MRSPLRWRHGFPFVRWGWAVETSLAWLVLGLAWIVASGVILGWGGWLGQPGFFLAHASGLAVLLVGRRRCREDSRWARNWLSEWWRLLRSGTTDGLIAGGFIIVLLLLAALCTRAEPMVFDALTYRLSRIGLWLQDGTIAHFQTADPRLNYMPVGPDMVIAWLVGSRSHGFLLAPLAGLIGGVLALGATFGLARLTGLGRRTAFGAMALLLGMANVAVQFTTIQSDLFTAGVFSASFFLWYRALLRGESSAVAGIGVALALGSKGTMFYLAPGAALWVGWLAWQDRWTWRAAWPTLGWAVLAALVLVLPGLWRNSRSYGGLSGPREAVILHHGPAFSFAQHAEKLAVNLGSSATQLLDPNAQPFWLQEACRWTGRRIVRRFSLETDPYLFLNVPRKTQLEQVMEMTELDADFLTCGIQGVLLFFVGLGLATISLARDKSARLVLVWGAGVIVFVVTQHGLLQWNQWTFRFLVLAAPWVAVVGAWGVDRLSGKLRVAVWTVALFAAVQVFAVVQWRARQAAWPAQNNPDHTMAHFVYQRWRNWALALPDAGASITIALPQNEPLAAFMRLDAVRRIELTRLDALPATAELAVQSLGGWLIVPAKYYSGCEGRVEKRVWLFNDDEDNWYSLAAYRRMESRR